MVAMEAIRLVSGLIRDCFNCFRAPRISRIALTSSSASHVLVTISTSSVVLTTTKSHQVYSHKYNLSKTFRGTNLTGKILMYPIHEAGFCFTNFAYNSEILSLKNLTIYNKYYGISALPSMGIIWDEVDGSTADLGPGGRPLPVRLAGLPADWLC